MSSSTYIGRSPRANDFWKLYLLLCKNTSVLLAHPLSTAIIILGPILLFLYTQIDQLINPKKAIDLTETRYPHTEITKPNITSIMYSPANSVLRHVIDDVATSLGANLTEAFLYASELQAALKAQDGFVGIEFDDKLRTIMEMPLKVKVALRFPLHLRSKMQWMWSSHLYKRIKSKDICAYDKEGFLIVQSKLSEALIRSRNESAYIPQIIMQPFPDGQRTDYSYLSRNFLHLVTHFTFIFMGPSLIIGQQIVAEKQRHLREVMRIMGLTIGLNWLSWFIVSYLIIFIPILIIVCLMKVFLCPNTPFGVLLFIFLIYLLTLICFTFMVSTFVTSTTMALTTITLLHMVSFLPYLIITSEMTPTKAVIVALFMNSAMASIWNQVCGFELRGVGAQWHKLFHYCHPDDKLSIGSMLLIMVGTNLIRLLCCFYADQLNLGEFGVAKRWYFPCKRKFWCPWERPRVDMPRRTHYDSIDEEEGPIVVHPRTTLASQIATHNKTVMMEAQQLNKTYGENKAVSDFNLKFFEDEVTVMIGPNGSGKTTLFMMLAGLLRPSSGRVIINGHDLALIPQQARKSLSVCTQHDVLFEDLSAYWHIVFFSRLKGYRRTDAEMEAQRYLEIMNLLDKSTISVSKLPLGMRRKLSICCALCANTKVVLCDEPTACLDPSARREVWSLLQREKSGRCIVMNTHIPEAAAVIGDRLAVLFDGQLYSYGSPEFIVNNLGPGYRLVCVALENCNVHEVTQFLLQRIETVDLEKIEGLEITYRLPVSDVLKFTSLFLALENKLEALHLTSFEVSAPTLSETFIKIGVEKTRRDRKSTYVELFNAWATEPIDKKEHKKWKRYKNDWHGLMIRKILFTRNHLFQFTLIVILPLFGILLSLIIDLIAKKSEMFVINPYDLTVYPGALVIHEFLTGKYIIGGTQIFTDNSQNVSIAYENMAMDAGATVRMSPDQLSLEDYLLKNINLLEEGFKETYVAGVTFRDGSVTAWYNQRLQHGAPLSLGLVYKAVAFVLVKMDIEIINKPRGDSDPSLYEHDNLLSSIKQAMYVMLYLCLAISAFILMPVQERVAQIKRQQLISGVNISTYWLSQLLWDYIIFLLITAVLLLAMYKQPIRVIYLFAIVMFIFGLSALTFTYLVSFLFKEPGAAMLYVLLINCFVVLLAIAMSGKRKDELCKHLHYIFLVLPFYAMYMATFEVFKLSKRSHECDSSNVENFEKCRRSLPVSVDYEIIYMALSAIIYFLLLLLSSKWRRFRYAIKRKTRKCVVHNEDPYVRLARQQIDKLVQNEEQLKECSLVCDRATKKIPHFLAANCVSLKISSNECFAIIGLNNAGKTSLVNMIVGSQMISQGDIYVKGLNVKTQLNKYYHHISYCPQHGHLVEYMTGRQMLRVVGLTSGIKKEFIPAIIAYVGQSFALDKHLDLKVKNYSSGTKRKLNVAMSMLGRTLICLDEPTTGVDIGAKEEIWIALRQMLDLGRSILITSHNMQECQMLSTCLAIMVNGNLCCYGNVEDVLDRYNKGISIKIQLATSDELQEINASNESESERSTIKSSSFRESDLTHHTRSLESDVAQSPSPSPEQNSPRVSEDLDPNQDPNSKATQVRFKKKESKRQSTVPTRAPISTPRTTIFDKSGTTSRRGTVSRRTTIVSDASYSMPSGTFSFLNSPEHWEHIKQVEIQFNQDFPGSYVADKNTYDGIVTIIIPDSDLKWSEVFKYLEQHRGPLQIKHYAISKTSLEDIFLEFASDQVLE